ncbi:uncharacterized protein LOC128207632 [Mya arenaria]|uniref:uncharacterized protein LOC128207632 n=1 Tax=Mya arenaria TaxID=6604 RepID=UPI0022E4335C|nr:uncharacterized protein LOC128207632 [Mya arenaria]
MEFKILYVVLLLVLGFEGTDSRVNRNPVPHETGHPGYDDRRFRIFSETDQYQPSGGKASRVRACVAAPAAALKRLPTPKGATRTRQVLYYKTLQPLEQPLEQQRHHLSVSLGSRRQVAQALPLAPVLIQTPPTPEPHEMVDDLPEPNLCY